MQNDKFSNTNDKHKTKAELRAEYEGETYSGEVVDADPSNGGNPVMSPAPDVPNIIVNGEKAEDWSEGDRMSLVKTTDVKKGDNGVYMFGERIKSDEEREQENANEFQVELKFMGNEMTSQRFKDEQDAKDLKEFLDNQMDVGRIEIVQKR